MLSFCHRANRGGYTDIDSQNSPSYNKSQWMVGVSLIVSIAISVYVMIFHFPSTKTSSTVSVVPFSNLVNSQSSIEDLIKNSHDLLVPYSIKNPTELNVLSTLRGETSKPSKIFGDLQNSELPKMTNSWCENFFLGNSNYSDESNKVFQLPYIIEAFEYFSALRAQPIRVQASDRAVMMIEEEDNGLAIGSVEHFEHHEVASEYNKTMGMLSIVLQWRSEEHKAHKQGAMMYSPIVRGSPYVSMIYVDSTPRIYAQRSISAPIVVDQSSHIDCGNGYNVFSEPFLVQREIQVQFAISDMSWLIFVSEPTLFICSNLFFSTNIVENLDAVHTRRPHFQSSEPHFNLQAVSPMKHGMVRIALTNNCTTGTYHAQLCDEHGHARDNHLFEQLIRWHSDIYPTGKSLVEFVFPPVAMEEDLLALEFNWHPRRMSDFHPTTTTSASATSQGYSTDLNDLLVYAVPHHQERMKPLNSSTNQVLSVGCTPTLYGKACPVIGSNWAMLEHLHRVSFYAKNPIRAAMRDAIDDALNVDLLFELPINYVHGAGDTYFSGKMLSKLARVLIIADEMKRSDSIAFQAALVRLKEGVEIWLNGSAASPFIYDRSWRGLVMCGCDFDSDTMDCRNRFPDCPALIDQGQNFGAGFYNDHHFHYGYHIYAAAVIAKFDPQWALRNFEHVLLLIRDIANPSMHDPYFPQWRYKDWYLGFSWASGIVTNRGLPYPNGRNQESISESVSAYEAVALYGMTMADIFSPDSSSLNFKIAKQISDMGRLLFATEMRSAKMYWHVQDVNSNSVRTYPLVYTPKVIGMMWSLLVQEQTWFGNEAYKSYGIQLLPITVAAELRDPVDWVVEMLPFFNQSCSQYLACERDGWSLLIATSFATTGEWQKAWKMVEETPWNRFDAAGGNGHSRSNTLWYIATRPDTKP